MLVGIGLLGGPAAPAQQPAAVRSGQVVAAADADPRPPAPFIREGTFNQNPSVGKLRGRTLRVKRPLLLVRDLERSIGFYVDLVGFELYSIEDTYDRRPESMGYALFNIEPGARKRMAMLNTSAEVRGLTLQEVRDMDWGVQQHPRTGTVLLETDDLRGIVARAQAAGFQVIEPEAGAIPASVGVPALRFMEGGIIDPDGHVLALVQYFAEGEEWQAILRTQRTLEESRRDRR